MQHLRLHLRLEACEIGPGVADGVQFRSVQTLYLLQHQRTVSLVTESSSCINLRPLLFFLWCLTSCCCAICSNGQGRDVVNLFRNGEAYRYVRGFEVICSHHLRKICAGLQSANLVIHCKALKPIEYSVSSLGRRRHTVDVFSLVPWCWRRQRFCRNVVAASMIKSSPGYFEC